MHLLCTVIAALCVMYYINSDKLLTISHWFVLICMHFSCWIQIWQWKFEFHKFWKKTKTMKQTNHFFFLFCFVLFCFVLFFWPGHSAKMFNVGTYFVKIKFQCLTESITVGWDVGVRLPMFSESVIRSGPKWHCSHIRLSYKGGGGGRRIPTSLCSIMLLHFDHCLVSFYQDMGG